MHRDCKRWDAGLFSNFKKPVKSPGSRFWKAFKTAAKLSEGSRNNNNKKKNNAVPPHEFTI